MYDACSLLTDENNHKKKLQKAIELPYQEKRFLRALGGAFFATKKIKKTLTIEVIKAAS
jgi:hypothetical protein